MATGRNSKPVQTPGAVQTQAATTDTQDTTTTAAPSTGGEGSQSADSSQQQAGALGHPEASNTAGTVGSSGETKGSDPAAAPTVTLSAEQFETLMGRLEAAEAKIENREQAEIAPKVELPSVKDLNLSKMKSPVLTKEGWLVPETYGANPNNKL